MVINCLGSNSKGNCYIIEDNDGQVLILECGINAKELDKALNYKYSSVKGCLITHEHKDHSKYYKDVINRGIDIYTSVGTKELLKPKFDYQIKTLDKEKENIIGNYIIKAFSSHHDAKDPINFLIYNKKEKKKIVFLTDTYYCSYYFKNVDLYMTECNHILDMAKNNDRMYVKTAMRHMSLQTLLRFLRKSDLNKTQKIMLLHLSDRNSDEQEMLKQVKEQTNIETLVADKDIKIEI